MVLIKIKVPSGPVVITLQFVFKIVILKNRMESDGLEHVRLNRMDSIITRNALWDRYYKNCM